MITAKSSFVEEKYTAQYYSGNGCLYVSGAGGVLDFDREGIFIGAVYGECYFAAQFLYSFVQIVNG